MPPDALEQKLRGLISSACQRSLRQTATSQTSSRRGPSAQPVSHAKRTLEYAKPRETLQQYNERMRALQEEREARELARCTFTPQINGGTERRKGMAHERLYNHALDKQEREQGQLYESERLDEEIYTFKPQLVAHYTPKTGVGRTTIRMTDVPDDMKECVFRPKLSPTSERICQEKFGGINVFDRLTGNSDVNSNSTMKQTSTSGPGPSTSGLEPERAKHVSTSDSFAMFLSRQEYVSAKKQMTASRINQEELRNCTFRPQISETSRAIAETLGARDPLYERPIVSRSRVNDAALDPDAEASFQPRINGRSRRLASARFSGPVFDRLYQDSETQHRLELMRQQQAQTEAEECTFQPRRFATQPEHVVSRIKEYDSYIDARKRAQELQAREKADRDAAAEDLSECTFQPKIIKAPASIRRIVDELRRSTKPDAGSA
ncbi:hypothetical protein GMRT_13834 [Giardia muris]|uniref:Uncharacterized protein n=1 Tax=Giardia muris TaxID=5742 RepID=A0A4Z1SQV5_GIAMU|nr:hypothetical protein GMRT_13834 [Giardia muris]|eukprot:TNJ27325.1 hypothetical protein GMRT_13834 [Giardia muris]